MLGPKTSAALTKLFWSLVLLLCILVGAESPVSAEPRERGVGRVFVAPMAPWKAFGPKQRYYQTRPPYRTEYTPTNTPVRLRPNRRFYIGPHYKSQYGAGYHTNGPGIGIVR